MLMFVDALLILEHSFFLCQQNIQDPIAAATQQYKSSGIPSRVAKAVTEVYPQLHEDEMCKKMHQLIMDVVSQNLICKP